MFFFNKIISKYPNPFSANPLASNIVDELNDIGNGKYFKEITICRDLYTKDKTSYSKAKLGLPALTFSGNFNGAHKKENLIDYSHFIIIDIDNLDPETIKSKKYLLFKNDFVSSIWLSPSGYGLKALINVASSPEMHKYAFDSIAKYLYLNFDIQADKSGSDICRLCFVSYDPDILMKEASSPFDFKNFAESVPEDQNPQKISTPTDKKMQGIQALEKELFFGTENRNSKRNRSTMSKIIKFLKKTNQSITSSYDDWFRVSLAIANSFTYDLGEKYFLDLCRQDLENHDEYKSKLTLEYSYRNRRNRAIDFSTIVFLSQKKGFKIL